MIHDRAYLIVILITITLSIVIFGGYFITDKVMGDERIYATQAHDLYAKGTFPRIYPLLSLLTATSLGLLGVTKYGYLLIPYISTSLTVFLVYFLSKYLHADHKRALVHSLLVASNPVVIWLSSKVMTETLFMLLLTLSISFLIRGKGAQDTFISAVFAFLAYTTRYAGILLILSTFLYLFISRSLRVTCVYLSIIPLLIVYWIFNNVFFGTYIPTEEYSLSVIDITKLTNLSLPLLSSIAVKVIMGVALILGYATPVFHSTIKAFLSKKTIMLGSLSKEKKFLILFILLYIIIHLGYFALISISTGQAWSADHFARYIVPILPILILYTEIPKSKFISHLVMLGNTSLGMVLGFLLIEYSDAHALNRMEWGAFLNSIRSRS
ncbi:MAG: glycosyltransferase family 39 protein [Nitrososphaerales archaeon]|nr:glycosyltransferase family 39 protein [Nitrososphaerales archaeon]